MALVDRLRAAAGFPKRAWERRTSRWGDIVERGAIAVAIVFIFIGFLSLGRAFDSIQDGRRTSQKIICATSSAVIDAGRATITGHAPGKPAHPPSPAVERALRNLGFPPFAVRQAQAEKQGQVYGRQIAVAIQKQIHTPGVVRKDGSLDCNALARVTNTK